MAGFNFDLNVLVKGLGGVTQLTNSVNRLDKQGASLANTFRVVRAALVAFGGSQIVGRAIELEKSYQKIRLSLDGVTGSVAKGGQAYQTAAKFSSEYGFELDKVLKSTQILLTNNVSLAEIPKYYNMIGAAARASGSDIDNVAEEFVKLKDTGLEGAKTLGPLFRSQFPQIYEAIKSSGTLSVQYANKFFGPNGQLVGSLKGGQGGIAAALNNVSLASDKFIAAFIGTDNAAKMNGIAKAINFLSENVVGLKFALGLLLPFILGPVGIVAALVLWTSALYDLYNAPDPYEKLGKKPGFGFTKKQIDEIKAGNKTIADSLGEINRQQNNMVLGLNQYSEALKDIPDQMVLFKGGVADALKTIRQENSTAVLATNALRDSFNNVSSAATQAFVGIIRGTMSARDAGRMLADSIINELVTAFVKIFIVGPIISWVAEQMGVLINQQDKETESLKKTNSELRKYLIYRTAAALLGFADGGQVKAGGVPARALGGPTTGNMPYMVGERGPELFVPSSNGTIIPNDKLNMGEGSAYGVSSGNMNITFNINTVDARDFDKLLTSRQDMIIGLINRGLSERGKRSLTA